MARVHAPASHATRALAGWVASPHPLPDLTATMAKRCVLDWLGAGYAGCDTPAGRIAAGLAATLGGPEESTLLSGGRGGCTAAALANGIASHAVEMDDLHRPSVMHLGTVTIPAALALAEREHCSGRHLLEAIACGYEVGARVAEACGAAHYRFWHVTGTAGALAAAGAGAVILGLSPAQTLDALGSAGTMAAGLWEFLADGAMSKTLHAGRAAEAGVLSALLARDGFTGSGTILEGEKGILRAMAGGGTPARLTDGLGIGYRIDENSFKLHAACGHIHPAIDAALELRRRGLRADEIARVHVRTFRVAIEVTGIPDPKNPYQAKFSLPFCVSLALARGRVGLGEFTTDTLADPALRALADRVKYAEDAACTAAYPDRWGAAVEVQGKGGDRHEVRVDTPRGSPDNPASDEALMDKFTALASRLSAQRRAGVAEAVRALEQVSDVAAIPWGSDAHDRR
ncbi:MAG TPA: MmgE/PrpD family protein [bacterium]|nr:MmgE/PrpD family protein [bacterium]